MRAVVTPETQADLQAAVDYLDRQPARRGSGLMAAFARSVRAIGSSPEQYPLAEDDISGYEVREYLITRFSQRLLYLIDGDRVVVFALIHASRRPAAWHRRLDQLP